VEANSNKFLSIKASKKDSNYLCRRTSSCFADFNGFLLPSDVPGWARTASAGSVEALPTGMRAAASSCPGSHFNSWLVLLKVFREKGSALSLFLGTIFSLSPSVLPVLLIRVW
jgi:hypothetical protein